MTLNARISDQIDRIYRLMEKGDFQNAGRACEEVTSQFPKSADAWAAAAEFFLRVSNPGRALEMVERAVKLDPKKIHWILLHCRCRIECGRTQDVAAELDAVAERQKLSPQLHNEIGMLLARLDDHKAAQLHYQQAVAAQPDEIEFLFNLATSQRFLGDSEDAERSLDRILVIKADDHEAAAMRSSLRKQQADNHHVDFLKSVINTGSLKPVGEVSFCYALAKELEDLGHHADSFRFLARGADLRRKGMRYDVSTDTKIMDQITQVFNQAFFDSASAGFSNSEAIFVMGLPRSGTTLLERILGSHSQVHAAGELGHFGVELTKLTQAVMKAGSRDRGQFVAASARINFAELGRNYIESARPLNSAKPRFTDKLPFNYLYAGLIHRALPDAKIICLRRHPMDSCYSMYKQLFRDAYPFSYDQGDLASYYLAFDRLMAHWEAAIPGVIQVVQYENLVSDTEKISREILAHCGLDWEDQCLEFYKNKFASTTASATQVRQKIYSSSIGRWRNYEKELQALRQTLLQAGIDVS